MDNDLEMISKALIEFWELEHGTQEKEGKFWAWQSTDSYVRDEPKRAWEAMLRTLKLAESEFIIECIAAHYLEGLMCEHGDLTMEFIVAEISENKKLAKCMSTVRLRISDTALYKDFYGLIGADPPFGNVP